MEHLFTETIRSILQKHFPEVGDAIFEKSHLLQYINLKTRSADKDAKARGSFANLYAVYVVTEDYVKKGFNRNGNYSKYEGAEFNKLFERQRKLPFGAKLQNHALNNRMNSEFEKFFPNGEFIPIIRNFETNRYWINENLIKISVGKREYNIAEAILEIIEYYARRKKISFEQFIKSCSDLRKIKKEDREEIGEFISDLLKPNADARLFEIVSYAILKYYYHDQKIYWGFDKKKIKRDNLTLHKTGRTNANDGGIDFVMKPLGIFFQVTETTDVKKYFLDIDKIHRYPITFVVKSESDRKEILKKIKNNALHRYPVQSVVKKYMESIEDIINIHRLQNYLDTVIEKGYGEDMLDEIILQSKVEFNYEDIE